MGNRFDDDGSLPIGALQQAILATLIEGALDLVLALQGFALVLTAVQVSATRTIARGQAGHQDPQPKDCKEQHSCKYRTQH